MIRFMAPKLSVIIPVYNTEKYLSECLDSVCAQTLKDMEIICIDDGSTDRCPDILAEYAARDDRIRVIRQSNLGEIPARNRGIREARGSWLGFVDSDDSVMPDMFVRLLANAEKYHADISHCGLLFCYSNGRKVAHFGTGVLKLQDHDSGLLDLLDGSQIEPSMCNKIYRAELFRDVQFDAPIRHNGDLVCNFELFGKADSAVYEDFCGYRYRRHDSSISSDWQSVDTLKTILFVRRGLMEKSTGTIRPAAYRMWLSNLIHVLNQLSQNPKQEAADFYAECRETLRSEKSGISCLNLKQQAAARLHLASPKLARLVYKIYGPFSLYRYEH